MSSDKRLKVLYISGFERSGSTILTKVLGELGGAFAGGELRGIWHCSYRDDQECGCGERFHDCDLWQEITEQAFGGFDRVNHEWMIHNRPKRRDTAIMLTPGGKRIIEKRFRNYIKVLDRLYTTIADVTGDRIIVDSSKTPLYGYALGLAPSVDLYVLHLIRDPRGTQCSNLRRANQGYRQLQNYSVTRSTVLWDMLHITQELFGRDTSNKYLRLRYEDFIENPIQTVENIKMFLDEPGLGNPTMIDDEILLSMNHTVSGNRNRTVTGSVPLRLDDRWQTELDSGTRSKVTRLTYPLLRRYGYA